MKEKLAKCLRAISVGKYQTTLYNKTGLPYMSSVLGGLITLVCVLIIAAYSVFLLISIFQKERYNLDMTTQEIRAYQPDENYRLQKNLTRCETGNCRDILVSDWKEISN
jgi:large-conductance mechanosensitive channel